MEVPFYPDDSLSGHGEVPDIGVIAEMTWQDLEKSVKDGYRTMEEAEALFYSWFSSR